MLDKRPQEKMSKKKIVRIILAVLLFIIICAAVDLAYMLLRVEISSPQWRLSDWFSRQKPGVTAVVTPEIFPTQTINYFEPVVLPGLTPSKLDDVLKRQNFTCSPVEIGISGFYQGQCSLDEADSLKEVYHFGRTKTDIDLIDANFTHKKGGNDVQAAAYFQSIVTSLGFSPNNQAEVLQWIDVTMPQIIEDRDIKEATFGGVRYRLYGAVENRSMEIGYLP